MTTLHMQTESVRAAARQMSQTAEQSALALNSLSRSVQALQASWMGGSSQEFLMESNNMISRLNTQVDLLIELAARLERETSEWEEKDRNGFGSLPGAAAGFSLPSFPPRIFPAIVIPSIGSLIVLPPWLNNFLNRFFPPETIVSPIPDHPVAPAPEQPAPAAPKSKLGELLEKAEKEKPAQAPEEKPAKTPKPAHISDYPARADDGTYLVGQEKDDSCSMASTKMAIHRSLGIDASESDLRKASNGIEGGYQDNAGKWGTSPDSLDDLVNEQYGDKATAAYNYPGSQSITDLDSAANDGKGIVVSVKNSEWLGSSKAHSVTVVDVTTENGQQVVLVNDPWPPGEGKRLAIPAEDFERAWYGDAMYIAPKPQE